MSIWVWKPAAELAQMIRDRQIYRLKQRVKRMSHHRLIVCLTESVPT